MQDTETQMRHPKAPEEIGSCRKGGKMFMSVEDMVRAPKALYDGWFFAYALTRQHLSLQLFRLIPLARVRLENIVYIRRRGAEDVNALWRHPFRYRYWPHPLDGYGRFRSHAYVAKCRSGARIYLRLKTGFHYHLRTFVGDCRSALERAPQPVSVGERAPGEAALFRE